MPTSGDAVIADYKQRRGDRLLAVRRWERRHAWLGGLRIAIAGLAALTLWFGGAAAWPWLGAELVLFVILIVVHARVLDARDRAQRGVDYYDRGLQRLRHEWPGHGDAGERFSQGPGSKVQGPGSVHLYATTSTCSDAAARLS